MSYSSAYYQKNKEKIIQRIKLWQKSHAEHYHNYQTNYKTTKKDQLLENRRDQYYSKQGLSTPPKTFTFYRDFLKPLINLEANLTIGLIEQFYVVSLLPNQFKILSNILTGRYTQDQVATSLQITKKQVGHFINKQLVKKLRPIINNYQTKNPELLNLIMKVIIQ